MRGAGLRGAGLSEAATKLQYIRLTGNLATEGDPQNTDVGVLSVVGATGVPTFTLDSDDGGRFQLNADGVTVEIGATPPAAGAHNITVSVSGVTPALPARTFTIGIAAAPHQYLYWGTNRLTWGGQPLTWG